MKLDQTQQAAAEQFARQSHHYGRGHVLEKVDDLREAFAQIDLPPHPRALDLATGAGHTAFFLASLGCEVVAADIAAPMLARVREGAAERGWSIETREHAAEELPYPGASFDLVTCRVAAHHFSSPPDFIRETARLLKPGGWFVLIDGSVADGQPEAEAWLHEVEKARDPSHHRLGTPGFWSQLCEANGLRVRSAALTPFKQPDLEWYFETAATAPENRKRVLQLIADAPTSARELFQLGEEEGKIVWWWQRLTLVAKRLSS